MKTTEYAAEILQAAMTSPDRPTSSDDIAFVKSIRPAAFVGAIESTQ
jgi:hypothetical protein